MSDMNDFFLTFNFHLLNYVKDNAQNAQNIRKNFRRGETHVKQESETQ
jgi:hypothetical protein